MRIKRTTNFDDDFDLDPNLNIKYDLKKVDSDSVVFVYFGCIFCNHGAKKMRIKRTTNFNDDFENIYNINSNLI